jgi:hypothetical protein
VIGYAIDAFGNHHAIEWQPAVPSNVTVSGKQFWDKDANGIMDGGDVPLSGVTIKVTAINGVRLVVTDGTYSLMIPAGPYTVSEVMPAGCIGTALGGLLVRGMVYAGTATSAANLSGLDFGNVLKGDADGSGMVDVADYQIWFNNYGGTTGLYGHGDFDESCAVDVGDYATWFNNYGGSMCGLTSGGGMNMPEPASMALLALGGLAMLRRLNRRV